MPDTHYMLKKILANITANNDILLDLNKVLHMCSLI